MKPVVSRRQALKGSIVAAVGVATSVAVERAGASAIDSTRFFGHHQSGITTPIQNHLVFATFDVTSHDRGELTNLLRRWTSASALLTEGHSLAHAQNSYYPPTDTGEAEGLAAAGLTMTFGFGPSLFDHRFALKSRRPNALIELPAFPGDEIDLERSNGDLCIQSCANDSIVAFHAVRNLARLGLGTVSLRFLQVGSGATSTSSQNASTPRNLLGFKDGTANLRASNPDEMNAHVWVGAETEQTWMRGGTYLVARSIRTQLEAWSSLTLEEQQATIGRFRTSGAPLTGDREHDRARFRALNVFGQPVIPAGAHLRVAHPEFNDGAKILRRGFNFTNGVDVRTGEIDAGLFFICFQQDPKRQFVTLQNNLSSHDALSNYVTHTSSALFACPPGAERGHWLGEGLFG